MKSLRTSKSTTRYPPYNHTSFNLDIGYDVTLHVSLHVKYALTAGGFWFGLRPEFDVHRATRKHREIMGERDKGRMLYTCAKCSRKEWGPVGMHRPDEWDFIHRRNFCSACVGRYSFRDLMQPS